MDRLPVTPSTGDLTVNPGMCPIWELSWQPFGPQVSTQSTEPHQLGPYSLLPIQILLIFKAQMKSHLGDVVPVGLVPVNDFISELQLHLLPLNLIVL